jgi:hypothetical protein
MRLLERWAELAFSASGLATTFMIGRYRDNGPRVGVCLLPFVPPPDTTVLTARQRRRSLSLGATFAWCTLASMAGTALADPIARALVGVAAFCGPVTYTADALHESELLQLFDGHVRTNSVPNCACTSSTCTPTTPSWRLSG